MTIKRSLRACFILILALCVVFTMTSGAFAATKVSSKTEALNVALKDAGLKKTEVKFIEKDYEDGVYEIEFTKKGTKREYSYEINKKGQILEKDVDYNRPIVKGEKKLTKAEAISKVASFSGIKKSIVKSGTVKLEKDDGQWKYEVKFKNGSKRYDYDVHAVTGKILEYSRKLIV